MTKIAIRGQRKQHGAGIVEGVAGLVLVITGAICAVLLLVNCGMAMYHKNRLGFVAMQTANYAASLPKIDQDDIKSFAKELLQNMGADSNEAAVETTEILVKGKAGVRVSITNKCILLESGYDFLPKSLALTDTAACVKSGGASGGMEGAGFMKFPLHPGAGISDPAAKFIWVPVAGTGTRYSPPGSGTTYMSVLPFPAKADDLVPYHPRMLPGF